MIAFIDCFLETPVHHCFNQFTIKTKIPATYHMVSRFGFDSLRAHSDSLTKYIILGSASNITEPLDWHGPLAKFIMDELNLGKPTLGICFGHQLIAKEFGCEVNFLTHDKTHFKELRDIQFSRQWGDYQAGDRIKLPYAHEQAVLSISDAMTTLASSDRSPFEVIAHKKLPYIGTQAHPEASPLFYQEKLGINDFSSHLDTGLDFLKNFVANPQAVS